MTTSLALRGFTLSEGRQTERKIRRARADKARKNESNGNDAEDRRGQSRDLSGEIQQTDDEGDTDAKDAVNGAHVLLHDRLACGGKGSAIQCPVYNRNPRISVILISKMVPDKPSRLRDEKAGQPLRRNLVLIFKINA
jgi:hypothetical protein